MDKLFEIKRPLLITDTILRDAHQSQAATRMRVEDMLPACEILDSIGYWSIECWGGATFDSCMRFLNEDPWERLRKLRKALPNTKLQMLLRGQNLLGYRHYSDDVVDAFCRKMIENGIDIVRIFDALNDVRNMETAIKAVKKYGGTVEAALSYTVSPVHSEEYFVEKAVALEKMGADVICIKDMANLLLPADAFSLVKKLKEKVSVPIHLHTHNTTGTGSMVYLAASQAGVDIVDCALSPFANGTSQPATESLVATLKGTDRDTGFDLKRLNEAAIHFKKVAAKMEKEGIKDNRKVGLYGLTYKENVDDFRESPTLQMLEAQERHLARPLKCYDPFLENQKIAVNQYDKFDDFLNDIDMVVIMVKHDHIKQNWDKLKGKVILDCFNICPLEGVYHI